MIQRTTFGIHEIELRSGRRFDLLKPAAYEGIENDIAHALGNLCRYSGHCEPFYSVAQHSVRVADRFNGYRRLALAGLLHDAHEAFVGDLSRPLKLALSRLGYLDGYEQIAAGIQDAIESHFCLVLDRDERNAVKQADTDELMREAFHLMPSQGDGWAYPQDTCPEPLNAVSSVDAAAMWLERFSRYSEWLT